MRVSEDVEEVPVETLRPYGGNARVHSHEQIKALQDSIRAYGFANPIIADEAGAVLAGHGRLAAAKGLGLRAVPVVRVLGLTEAQKRGFRLADNRLSDLSYWDEDALALELEALDDLGLDLSVSGLDGLLGDTADGLLANAGDSETSGGPDDVGYNADKGDAEKQAAVEDEQGDPKGRLAGDFIVPPFSVFDLRGGHFLARKALWGKVFSEAAEGRAENLCYNTSSHGGILGKEVRQGTSVFNPAVSEVLTSWFSPPAGSVLDPFCGGACRGVVAGSLGRRYIGYDIREEQVENNKSVEVRPPDERLFVRPRWECGDSSGLTNLVGGERFDFLFSCPPYGDLEKYNGPDGDISMLTYECFLKSYRQIIAQGVESLLDDRFAVFVVGDFRDSRGILRDFVGDTVAAFSSAGVGLYDRISIISPVGTGAVRARRPFSASRKLVPLCQEALVFIKGDAKKAAEACGGGSITNVFSGVKNPLDTPPDPC